MEERIAEMTTDYKEWLEFAVNRQRRGKTNEERINGMLEEISFFYQSDRVLLVETDWKFDSGTVMYEYCAEDIDSLGFSHFSMKEFSLWAEKLKSNHPVIISYDEIKSRHLQPFENISVRRNEIIMAAPVCRQYNTGFVTVCDPKVNQTDITFLQVVTSMIAGELNEMKLRKRIDIVIKQHGRYPETDIYISCFGGLKISHRKGILSDEVITADQCYRLLAFLLLNHKKNKPVRDLAEIIWEDSPMGDPYRDIKNVVYRLKRFLAVVGLEDLIVGANGTFVINPHYNLNTDFNKFEQICVKIFREQNIGLLYHDFHIAKKLYKGILFPRCDHIHWFMPVISYYQNLYLLLLKRFISHHFDMEDYMFVQKASLDGLEIEPYDTDLMTYQVICMYKLENRSLAASYLNKISEYLTEQQKVLICYHTR